MKAIVIGCGYVGSAVALELARGGHEVSGLRRGTSQDEELLRAGVRILQADITDPEGLGRIKPEFDWVVNTAAASGGGAEDYRRIYLDGTRNVIIWLRGSRARKYVYTSSTGVYAQDDGSVVDETCPAEPETETGRVLADTERVVLKAADGGFPGVIFRVSGIYGPGRGYWLKQFLSGEARMDGDGGRWLNMIHRDDVAGAIIAGLEKGRPGEVYNVSDNEPATQRQVFEWLSLTTGRPVPETGMAARRRSVTNKRISNFKLRTEIGYPFKYPTFREGYASLL